MKKSTLTALILCLVTSLGCGARELTPEQRQQLEALRKEQTEVREEITNAQTKDDALAGGLIKSLVGFRIEVLMTTEALIQQRIQAIESGARISVEVPATEPDPQEAERLLSEIATQEEELQAAQEDADRYSGGLVRSLKLTTVATKEQTLAMLQQRHLAAKYGLAIPSVAGSPASHGRPEPPDKEGIVQQPGESAPTLEAREGPFGLEAGLLKDTVEDLLGSPLTKVEGAPFLFSTARTPRPHSSFEFYALLIGPTTGLCQIRAIGVDITTSSHGLQLKSQFEELSSSLEEVYGPYERVDQLLPGSIWKDPEDWMMGLLKKERYLQAEWSAKNRSNLRNSITAINLVARAKGSDVGFLLLQYTFDNDPQCQKEIKKGEKAAL